MLNAMLDDNMDEADMEAGIDLIPLATKSDAPDSQSSSPSSMHGA